MNVIYILCDNMDHLQHNYCTHDIIGLYASREGAEKAAKEYHPGSDCQIIEKEDSSSFWYYNGNTRVFIEYEDEYHQIEHTLYIEEMEVQP